MLDAFLLIAYLIWSVSITAGIDSPKMFSWIPLFYSQSMYPVCQEGLPTLEF